MKFLISLKKEFKKEEYYFSLIVFSFLVYFYLVIYSYLLSVFRYFSTNAEISALITQKSFFYLVVITLIFVFFMVIIRFHYLNILVFIFSLIVEYLINKTLINYLLPFSFFYFLNNKEIMPITYGLLFYLSFFIINYRKNFKEMLFLFLINNFVFILITLASKISVYFMFLIFIYLITYPFFEERLIILIKKLTFKNIA